MAHTSYAAHLSVSDSLLATGKEVYLKIVSHAAALICDFNICSVGGMVQQQMLLCTMMLTNLT